MASSTQIAGFMPFALSAMLATGPLPAGEPADEDGQYRSVVKADRPKTTATEKKIEQEDIDLIPKKSAEDALKLVPGMLVVQHGAEGKGHQFFLRGFDAAHGSDIEVTVGGIPINDISNVHGHGYIDLYFIPPEVIRSITVHKGPFLVTQSDLAMAGSLELELGWPAGAGEWMARIESGYPLRNRLFFIRSLPAGDGSFVLTDWVMDEGYGKNRDADRVSSLAMLKKQTARGELQLLAGGCSARFGSPTALRLDDYKDGKIGFYDSYTDVTDGRSDRVILSLSDTIDYGGGAFKLSAAGLLRQFEIEDDYTGYLLNQDKGDFRRQEHRSVTGYVSAALNQKIISNGHRLSILVKGEWRGDWIDQAESLFEPSTGESWLFSRDARAGLHRIGIGAALEWSPCSWFSVEGGVRADVFLMWLRDGLEDGEHYGDVLWAPSPRIAMKFPVAQVIEFFAAYGRGLRSPEARSIMVESLPDEDVELKQYLGGSPDVARADAVEAGAHLAWKQYLDISAAFFATFVSNEMVFDHVSNTNIAMSDSRRLGGELEITARPTAWLALGAFLTGVDARFSGSGNRIPGAPWLVVSGHVSVRHPIGIEGAIHGFYVAPRPLAHGATGDHQVVLDFSAAYRWRFLKLSVHIENFTNNKWRDGQYHFASWFDRSTARSMLPVIHYTPGRPITVMVGATFIMDRRKK